MDSILLSIDPRDPLWIALAFLCGFGVKLIGLPPLVGFLIAGFILNAAGAEGGEFLRATADLGVTLLLFSIGLKLKLRSLASPEVWGVAIIHMVAVTALAAALIMTLTVSGLPMITDIDIKTALLIGFALSFSSTVFAVKVLEDMGATTARHGSTAIGVLIVQDIAAVAFLAASTGKIPSIWAITLLGLLPLRHILRRLLNHTGHGELLVLYGIVLAVGGADLFELVGLKGDLGALVLGMLLANHPKAGEMANSLLSFKDLFLVGFFLSVGMTAVPGWPEIFIALLLIAFLPIKTGIYLGLFTLFRLRASTAWRTSLNLASYSEFGLIVGTIAAAAGWLPKEWLAVFAIALSVSFIVAAPAVSYRDQLYTRWRKTIKRLERPQRLSGEEDFDVNGVDMVVFGMGRIGSAVYDAVKQDFPGRVLGVDLDVSRVQSHHEHSRRVIQGDATNPDFWTRAPGLVHQLKWVMLTMDSHQANMAAVVRLRALGYSGDIAATTQYPDEVAALKNLGVDYAFDIYSEAGIGFANDIRRRITPEAPS